MPSLPRFILIFFFLSLALQGQAAEKVVTIFILAGQSNMEGHGRIAGNQKEPSKACLGILPLPPATVICMPMATGSRERMSGFRGSADLVISA